MILIFYNFERVVNETAGNLVLTDLYISLIIVYEKYNRFYF